MSDRPASNVSDSRFAYWCCQWVGWGLYTLPRMYAAIAVLHLPWLRAASEAILLTLAGMAMTHWFRGYMRRRRWSALPVLRLTWRIIVAGLVLGTPLGLLAPFTAISALQDPGPLFEGVSHAYVVGALVLNSIANWAALFMIWLAIYFAVLAARRHRWAELRQSELARALQQAELRLLKSQINPHFLFNALNTVRSLIADEPARAQRAVTHLANTLRYALRSDQHELVTLAQELDIVADYLDLESMRFEDRLTVRYEVPADAGSVRIPVMLLQTVVENAIKHGIAELPSGGVLKISAVLEGDSLCLEVENPRPATPSAVPGEGTGLRNSEERLRLLFGSRASLELDLSQAAIAKTRIRIPRNP